MTDRSTPRVFSIPPAAPFLPTLVGGILDGTVLPGRRFRDDPLALADLTIFLPTRRAARALGGAFLAALGGEAAVLPRIRPLGDVDDDGVDGLVDPILLELPPAIGEPDRLLGLARLILDWRRFVTTDRLLSPSGQPITVPTSTADALHLAADLLALIDQAAAEGIDWTRLSTLVPDDYAAWWQLTLTFLTIATDYWPQHLAELGLSDPGARRAAVTLALADRMERRGAGGPVIAAGSTGSLPATARLLRAIAHLPDGAVVLPGLDFRLDSATFASLAPDGRPGAPSHPQAALARLLGTIGIDRADVRTLGTVEKTAEMRADIVSEALRPAESTDRWPAFVQRLDRAPAETTAALSGLRLVVAANEAEEALAVALALRETLEDPDATAALVTPDRGLARRVCAELARFGLTVEDSAGTPLARSVPGVLALLTAECATEGLPPEKLVALAKHPLARFGFTVERLRPAVRALEIACLRGPRLRPGGEALVTAADTLARPGRKGHGVHASVQAIDAQVLEDARLLARRIAGALAPLEALSTAGEAGLDAWIEAHLAAVRAVSEGADGGEGGLFEGPAGSVLAQFYADYTAANCRDCVVVKGQLSATLSSLMRGYTVRRTMPDARLSIWGPLEARMMSVDRLVIGGLNEGVWPLATDTGPWLSRPMRAGLGFAPPEQRIGLSAHDFAQCLGTRDVVMTRSAKKDGAPTVPTRFLQRLTGLIGKARTAELSAAGAVYADWARRLDDGPPVARAARPEPAPALSARPRRLNVTEIETWIRDPYAIYARRILKLEPLPDLGERPDFGTRGSVLHAALAEFAREWDSAFDRSAVDRLVEIGRAHFRELEDYPELHALWWPRFCAAADFLVREFEAKRPGVERVAEVSGTWEVVDGDDGFTLVGRADRIDILPSGRLSIVDFKTGNAPSASQIANLKAPQLPLEAAIAARGGFQVVKAAEAAELVHVVLRGIRGKDDIRPYSGYDGKGQSFTLAETIERTEDALRGLVEAYRDPARGYLSRAHPFSRQDRGVYDHLARVAEWSVGSDDDGPGSET